MSIEWNLEMQVVAAFAKPELFNYVGLFLYKRKQFMHAVKIPFRFVLWKLDYLLAATDGAIMAVFHPVLGTRPGAFVTVLIYELGALAHLFVSV